MAIKAHNVGWSMQQVDAEAAFIARTAAYAAGLSVTDWLHQLVLGHTEGQEATPPTPVPEAERTPTPTLPFTMQAPAEASADEMRPAAEPEAATPLVYRRPQPVPDPIAEDARLADSIADDARLADSMVDEEPLAVPDLSADMVVEADEPLVEPALAPKDGVLTAPLRNVPEERPSQLEPPKRLVTGPAPAPTDPGLDDHDLATLRAIISRKDPDPVVATSRPTWRRLAILPALLLMGAGAWALTDALEDPAASDISGESVGVAEVTLPPTDPTTLARPRLETLDTVVEVPIAAPAEDVASVRAESEDLPLPASKHVGAYRRAAGAGDPEAQLALGQLYAAGDGVKQDHVLAAAWYRAAAESNLAPAQLALGKLQIEGLGIDRDPAEAAIWFHRAAQLDLPAAKYELGRLYWQGDGVTRDRAAAFRWLRLAEADGFPPARKALTALMAEMSAADISRGEALLYDQPSEPLSEAAPAAGDE